MKKILLILIGFTLALGTTVYALPFFSSHQTMLPFVDDSYDLGTSTQRWRNVYISGSVTGGTYTPTGLSADSLVSTNSLGALVSTSSPTIGYLTATSTTATSTFAGNVDISGNLGVAGAVFTPINLLSSGAVTGTHFIGTSGSDTSTFAGNVSVTGTGTIGTLTGLIQGSSGVLSAISNSSTVGQILRVTGASTYAWGALDLDDSDAITGTLSASNIEDSYLINSGNDTTTGQLTATNFVASSASATSILAGGLAIETSGFVYDYSTNNVGIGTASPDSLLEVAGKVNLAVATPAQATLNVDTNNTPTTGASAITTSLEFFNNTSVNVASQTGNVYAVNLPVINLTDASAVIPVASNLYIAGAPTISGGGSITNSYASYIAGGTSYFGGNVGIGVTTPAATLNVNGTSGNVFLVEGSTVDRFSVGATGAHSMVGGTGSNVLSITNTGGGDFLVVDTSKFIVKNGGNVGIGTTSPAAKFVVSEETSSMEAALHINSVNSNPVLRLQQGGATKWSFIGEYPNAGALSIFDGVTNDHAMVIRTGGNVGIGTTTPSSLLSVGNTSGINFRTATSTFSSTGGIDLASGCFSIAGTCVGGAGGGGTNLVTPVFSGYADIATSGTSETNLHTHTNTASRLATDGQWLEYSGTLNSGSDVETKTIKLYWNGVAFGNITTDDANSWTGSGGTPIDISWWARITRTGAATQRIEWGWTWVNPDTITNDATANYATGTATLTGTIIFKVTGQIGGGGGTGLVSHVMKGTHYSL